MPESVIIGYLHFYKPRASAVIGCLVGSLKQSRSLRTRGIWKVSSMVFYLRNRLTNPFTFDIILNSYLSSMFGHKFHVDTNIFL